MNLKKDLYREAQDLAAEGKIEAALLAFVSAFKSDPGNFRAAFGAGLMHQRLEEHEEAVTWFTTVIGIPCEIAEAFYSRALSLKTIGRNELALQDLDKAIGLNPKYWDAVYLKGAILKAIDPSRALEQFTSVLSSIDHHPEASFGRATVRHMLGDYAGAIADFSNCLANGHDCYDLRLLRGLAYFRTGSFKEAVADLSIAIALRPEETSAYVHRWRAYLGAGDAAKAAEDLKIVKKLLPSSASSTSLNSNEQ
jgi:tetratricopeptide (TPR) repeat protein